METISHVRATDSPQRASGQRTPIFDLRIARLVVLVAVVALLEVLVLRSYLLGRAIPPWDFLGSYNTDAYFWWAQGGFFTPPDWIANVWAGYPSALNLQNSAWFLPVGIASALGPFTLQAAGLLAAMYVALGFFGTYLLIRSLRVSFPVALVAATAGFFAVGYYSNAQHVDIARAYALIPFVLLVLSPGWPWTRWWGVPLGAFVLWQSVTGIYPGMIVTTVYVGVVWVAVHQLSGKLPVKRYLLPLAIAGVSAILLSMPRLLPYFLLQGESAAGLPETSAFSPEMIGTLLYGYASPDLPNDISMRSLFVPATVLLLAFFARWRDPATRGAVAIGAPALLLGMPFWPWFGPIQSLPGLGLSRFSMSDFKPFLILAVIMLAASGLTHLIDRRMGEELSRRRIVVPTLAAGLFVAVMGAVGALGPFLSSDWRPGFIILAASYAVIVIYLVLGSLVRIGRVSLVVLLLVGTVGSGAVWAYTTQAPWNALRLPAEDATYGATVDDLLEQEVGPGDAIQQRPARLPLEADYTDVDIYSVEWNRVFYTNQSAVGGYLNLKGSETQAQLLAALTNDDTDDGMAAFLAAPGLVFSGNQASDPDTTDLEFCISTADCGPVSAVPAGYEPGHIAYKITADEAGPAILNEAYYPGWSATACTAEGECSAVETSRSNLGVVQMDLPKGEYVLELTYRTPGRSWSWVLFALGVFSALLPPVVFAAGRRSTRRKVQKIE